MCIRDRGESGGIFEGNEDESDGVISIGIKMPVRPVNAGGRICHFVIFSWCIFAFPAELGGVVRA